MSFRNKRMRYFERLWLSQLSQKRARLYRRFVSLLTNAHPFFPWWALHIVDRHPDSCWAALVSWKIFGDTGWAQTDSCRADRDRNGACYCGKLTTPAFRAERDRLLDVS